MVTSHTKNNTLAFDHFGTQQTFSKLTSTTFNFLEEEVEYSF